MIDFTHCKVDPYKAYSGANGQKICVLYDGVRYMLKFPSQAKRNQAMSYSNGCLSEYLACHIFASMGFNAQETLLGTYTMSDGRVKTVVACKDFNVGDKRLIEFAQLKNTCINSEQNGYGTELSSILTAIEEQQLIPAEKLRAFFWDMFIADALLGNFDRHNGNWGLLVDETAQTAEIAPIYDCGSCLFPQLDPAQMEAVLHSEAEIENRVFVFPTSAIEENGQKINYFDYISSLKEPECTAALQRVYAHIDLNAINEIIAATPGLTQLQKDFYSNMIHERYTRILEHTMEMVQTQAQKEPDMGMKFL